MPRKKNEDTWPKGIAPHLFQGDHGFYARMGVPVHLREIIGKREFSAPVHATTPASAKRKLHAIVAGFQKRIEDARAQANSPAPIKGRPLAPRQLATAQYESHIRSDQEFRQADPRYVEGFIDEDYVANLRRVVNWQANSEEMRDTLGVVARYYENRKNIAAEFGTPKWREAVYALAVAELEGLGRTAERDEGIFDGTPKHPLLTAKPEAPKSSDPLAARNLGPDSEKTLAEILPNFLKERKPSSRAADDYAVTTRLFVEATGEEKSLYAITRADIIAFKNKLLELPANHTKRFPGLSVTEAIEKNKARQVPFEPLGSKRINNGYLSSLRSLLNWCVGNEIIPDNPATGIKAVMTERRPKKKPFTPGDLAKIFSKARFKGKKFDETQWALLVSLFTGTRASETAQIKLDSIRTERRILVFVIEEKTKTDGSQRIVPVHSTLIRLGFQKYVDGLRHAGQTHLFPDWYAQGEAKGNFDKYIPERFRVTTMKNLEIEGRKDWHSFRRNFLTGLNLAGVDDAVKRALGGHVDGSAHGVYIHGHAVEVLKKGVEKLRYDGFTLA